MMTAMVKVPSHYRVILYFSTTQKEISGGPARKALLSDIN